MPVKLVSMFLCFWLLGNSHEAPVGEVTVNKGMTEEKAEQIGAAAAIKVADALAPMVGKQIAAKMRANAGAKNGTSDETMGSHVASVVAHRVYPAYGRKLGVLILKAIRKSMAESNCKHNTTMGSKLGAEIGEKVALDFTKKVRHRVDAQVGSAEGEALSAADAEINGAGTATAGGKSGKSGAQLGTDAAKSVGDSGLANLGTKMAGRDIGAAIGAALAMEASMEKNKAT